MSNGHRGGSRQTKDWFSTGSSRNVITAEGTTVMAGQLGSAQAQTILRIRGEFLIAFNAATAASDACLLTFGIGVVSTDAAVGGAVPDPAVEGGYPWMWYKSVPMQSTFAIDGTGTDHSGQLQTRVEVDSKAMRRIKASESLAFIVQYTDLNGLPPVVVLQPNFRILLGH